MNYAIFCSLTVALCTVFCVEIPENSCRYFSYVQSDYSYIYGRLILPNDGLGQYDLHVSASIRGLYDSIPNLQVTLVTSAGELYAGSNIEYWVYFSFSNNIPKITSVSLNGVTYCSGPPFSLEDGMGTTSLWAQYFYDIGTRNPALQNTPIPAQHSWVVAPSNQRPTEVIVPLEQPSGIDLSPQNPHETSTTRRPSVNVHSRPRYPSTVPTLAQREKVTPTTPQYSSKAPSQYTPTQLQNHFDVPISSEESSEASIPLLSPSKASTQSLQPSKVAATTQTIRQKPQQSGENFEPYLASFFHTCGTPNEDDNVSSFRIFNGRPTIEGQYPWLAALLLLDGSTKGSYKCVANLISGKHLLTAAHCVNHFEKEDLLLQFYSSDTTNDQTTVSYFRSITDIQISPYYITEPFGDVALLTINQSIVFSGVTMKPICLWSGGKELDYTGTVAGWGLDENGLAGIGTPKAVDISMVSASKCIETYGLESDYRLFSDYCFCTAHTNAMPCRGDSGAGFMVRNDERYFLRGIVSVGYRFCGRSSYTIFVDIVPHVNWILGFVG